MQFYNTLNRKKEKFNSLQKGKVSLYTCGPTVYDYAHIGNFRTFLFEDILIRYLQYKGYKVKFVMNITDIDDKTIKASSINNVPLKEYTKKYENAFFEDITKLRIRKAECYPRATEHINNIVKHIKKLKELEFAYESNGSVYFSISKFSFAEYLIVIDLREKFSFKNCKSSSFSIPYFFLKDAVLIGESQSF